MDLNFIFFPAPPCRYNTQTHKGELIWIPKLQYDEAESSTTKTSMQQFSSPLSSSSSNKTAGGGTTTTSLSNQPNSIAASLSSSKTGTNTTTKAQQTNNNRHAKTSEDSLQSQEDNGNFKNYSNGKQHSQASSPSASSSLYKNGVFPYFGNVLKTRAEQTPGNACKKEEDSCESMLLNNNSRLETSMLMSTSFSNLKNNNNSSSNLLLEFSSTHANFNSGNNNNSHRFTQSNKQKGSDQYLECKSGKFMRFSELKRQQQQQHQTSIKMQQQPTSSTGAAHAILSAVPSSTSFQSCTSLMIDGIDEVDHRINNNNSQAIKEIKIQNPLIITHYMTKQFAHNVFDFNRINNNNNRQNIMNHSNNAKAVQNVTSSYLGGATAAAPVMTIKQADQNHNKNQYYCQNIDEKNKNINKPTNNSQSKHPGCSIETSNYQSAPQPGATPLRQQSTNIQKQQQPSSQQQSYKQQQQHLSSQHKITETIITNTPASIKAQQFSIPPTSATTFHSSQSSQRTEGVFPNKFLSRPASPTTVNRSNQQEQQIISQQHGQQQLLGTNQSQRKSIRKHSMPSNIFSTAHQQPIQSSLQQYSGEYIPCLYLKSKAPSNYIGIYFHGNGEDISLSYELTNHIRTTLKINILAVEYKGYGMYKGNTSDNSILEDARYIYIFLTQVLKYQSSHIIVFGRSIGTGPATWLAANHRVKSLVLVSPFSSIRALVKHLAGSIAQHLVKERFVNSENIQKVSCATFIVHGQADPLIPYSQSQLLHDQCGGPCYLVIPRNMTHTQLDFSADLTTPLNQFFMKNGININEENHNLQKVDHIVVPEYLQETPPSIKRNEGV